MPNNPLTNFDVSEAHYLIDGKWQVSTDVLALVDPSTGDALTTIGRGGQTEVDAAVTAAQSARAGIWGNMTACDRGRILTRLGNLILTRVDD